VNPGAVTATGHPDTDANNEFADSHMTAERIKRLPKQDLDENIARTSGHSIENCKSTI
jgi:hypothetical protein